MFYLTGKQVKTKKHFTDMRHYDENVTSLVEDGDTVKCLVDVSHCGVKCGDTGKVVGGVFKGVNGRNCVTVRWDKRGNDLNMRCDCIEILN